MARVQQDDPGLLNSSLLQLRAVPVTTSDITLLCDMSTGTPCPYMPQPFLYGVFNALHSLSHPGIHAMQRLVTAHYVWPEINADIRCWAH